MSYIVKEYVICWISTSAKQKFKLMDKRCDTSGTSCWIMSAAKTFDVKWTAPSNQLAMMSFAILLNQYEELRRLDVSLKCGRSYHADRGWRKAVQIHSYRCCYLDPFYISIVNVAAKLSDLFIIDYPFSKSTQETLLVGRTDLPKSRACHD